MSREPSSYSLVILALLLCFYLPTWSAFPVSAQSPDDARDLALDKLPAFVFPIVAPRFSSNYGYRKHPILKTRRHHSGVDMAAPQNAHVRAALAGTVVFADVHGGYGKLVTILHENGYSTLYGHLNEILVNPGDKVTAGSLIGRLGSTGRSTGPHLHFEIHLNGKPLDPVKVFPSLGADAKG